MPTREVAQEALIAPGREFRYPVVLPARGGRHGGHFGDRGDDGEEAEKGPDVGPEESSEPAVVEALGDADEEEFPGRLQHDGEAEDGEGGEGAQEGLGFAHAVHVGAVGGGEARVVDLNCGGFIVVRVVSVLWDFGGERRFVAFARWSPLYRDFVYWESHGSGHERK